MRLRDKDPTDKLKYRQEDKMLTRITIELDRSESGEFRRLVEKMIQGQPVVEIRLTPVLRNVFQQIHKDIVRWDEVKKGR